MFAASRIACGSLVRLEFALQLALGRCAQRLTDTRTLKSRVRQPLPPISAQFIPRRLHMGRNMRAEVRLFCPLFAFEFGFRSEPELVASTVRPARIIPQLMGAFADPLFICIHVMASSLTVTMSLAALRRCCSSARPAFLAFWAQRHQGSPPVIGRGRCGPAFNDAAMRLPQDRKTPQQKRRQSKDTRLPNRCPTVGAS